MTQSEIWIMLCVYLTFLQKIKNKNYKGEGGGRGRGSGEGVKKYALNLSPSVFFLEKPKTRLTMSTS